jgi:hypothetical protein
MILMKNTFFESVIEDRAFVNPTFPGHRKLRSFCECALVCNVLADCRAFSILINSFSVCQLNDKMGVCTEKAEVTRKNGYHMFQKKVRS